MGLFLSLQDGTKARQFKLNVRAGAFTDSEILVMLGEVRRDHPHARGGGEEESGDNALRRVVLPMCLIAKHGMVVLVV